MRPQINHKTWLFPAAGVVVLASLFFLFKPRDEVPVETRAAEPETVAAVAAPPQARVFDLVVEQGRLVSGPAVVMLRQGDEIVLRVRSDRDDELHLHGYDLHLPLKAGVPADLHFTADKSGRFEYELHRAHVELGALEVQPQ